MRSIVALTGSTMPEGYRSDGEDVSATLFGQSEEGRRSELYWRRPPDRPSTPDRRKPDLAIRDGKWKLVADLDGQHAELYDLSQDPNETQDLASKESSTAQKLVGKLLEWNRQLPDAGSVSRRR